jgi:hypothetical protein
MIEVLKRFLPIAAVLLSFLGLLYWYLISEIVSHEGSLEFRVENLKNPTDLIVKLQKAEIPLSAYLKRQFPSKTQQLLDKYQPSTSLSEELKKGLVDGLNQVLINCTSLYDKPRFDKIKLTKETQRQIKKLNNKNLLGTDVIHLNWSLLAEAYPDEITKIPTIHAWYRGLIIIGLFAAFALGVGVFALVIFKWHYYEFPTVIFTILIVMMVVFFFIILPYPDQLDKVSQSLEKIEKHYWIPVGILVIVSLVLLRSLLRYLFYNLLYLIKKAELPGGIKVELNEVKESSYPERRTISDFSSLIARLCALIDSTPHHDIVRFLAYTPAVGYLARSEKEWDELYDRLNKHPRVQITCLKEDELRAWHLRFEDKRTLRQDGKNGRVTKKLIEGASRVSERILSRYKRCSILDGEIEPIRGAKDQLPGYYLFANESRAIVVAPLLLPEDSKHDGIESYPVQLVGIETADRWTVRMVHQVCEMYRSIINRDNMKTNHTQTTVTIT